MKEIIIADAIDRKIYRNEYPKGQRKKKVDNIKFDIAGTFVITFILVILIIYLFFIFILGG